MKNRNWKTFTMKKLTSFKSKMSHVMVGALLLSALAACSSNEAPTNVIMEAVNNSHNEFWQANFTFDNLKVTNSYTRSIDNETVNFYGYSIDAHPKDTSNKTIEALMGGEQTLTGEVELAKRGNSWFDVSNH